MVEGEASPDSRWGGHRLLNLFKCVLGGGNGSVVKSVPLLSVLICSCCFCFVWHLFLFSSFSCSFCNSKHFRIQQLCVQNGSANDKKQQLQTSTTKVQWHKGGAYRTSIAAITDLISEDFFPFKCPLLDSLPLKSSSLI